MTLDNIIEEYKITGDKDLYREIIEIFTPMINKLIANYPHSEKEDLFNTCVITLPKAIKAYDKDKGAKITTYVLNYCKGELQRYFKKKNRETIIEYDDYIKIEAPSTNIDLKIEVESLLPQILTELETNIIKLKYGFYKKTYTFTEINEILNIKSSFYYHNIAISKLQNSDYFKNFYK